MMQKILRTLTIGTCHFRNVSFAENYYAQYGYNNARKAVKEKIKSGEISIGFPDLKNYPNAIRLDIDKDGRFHVVCKEV